MLGDGVLAGIGSGGPGFNNYRPEEMSFLIALTMDLKRRGMEERASILTDYDTFTDWMQAVPRQGSRQFRHMLRFFAFPDLGRSLPTTTDGRSWKRLVRALARDRQLVGSRA